jgi:two-component system, chemotaxis family, response regulator Rcp1
VSQAPNKRLITILLVDDNPADVRLTIEAFKDVKIFNRLDVARDGEEAIRMLRDAIAGVGTPVPDLIILDVNLPKKDGCDVLAEIKIDPDLRRIPVIVLTTSHAEKDVVRSYDLHANCYIVKPIDFERYLDVVKSIEAFWLSEVWLPGQR